MESAIATSNWVCSESPLMVEHAQCWILRVTGFDRFLDAVMWYTPLTSFEPSGNTNSGVDCLTTRDFTFTVQLLDETAPFGTWRTNPCPFLRSKVRSSFPLIVRCSTTTVSNSGRTKYNSIIDRSVQTVKGLSVYKLHA